MAESQGKVATQPTGEQQQQSQPMYGIQQHGAAAFAAVGAYPSYYPYPPPQGDGNGAPGDPNVATGAPPGAYMMAFAPPPGMIYAYPTSQGYPTMSFPGAMPLPAALVRPKRKQVKMACTNCAAACKRCDEARPCERCCKYGIADSCQDGVRKERKKGIKRGPYKRKGKVNPEAAYEGFTADQNPAEGFYPSYFYPPPSFIPIGPGPDGQPAQPDAANGAAGQPAIAHPQYYPLHPAAYPPFAYPHAAGAYPAMMAGHLPMPQQSNAQVADASSAPIDPSKTTGNGHKDDGGHNQEGDGSGGRSPPTKSRKRGKAANKDDGGTTGNKKAGRKNAAQEVDDTAGAINAAGQTSSLDGATMPNH